MLGSLADGRDPRVVTREEALTAAAKIYAEALIRIETERIIAEAQANAERGES